MHDSALRRALGYARFGATPRVLLFDSGYLVVGDLADALEDLGWHLFRLATPKQGQGEGAFVRTLLEALVTQRPDYVLTVNHLGFDEKGALAGLLDDYDIPVASWFVDHPLPILGGAEGNATANVQLFCFERTALPWLTAQRYEEPVYLPTASNARYFVGNPSSGEASRALTFAGNSWWTKARLEPPPWARKAARALCRDPRGVDYVLQDRFRKRLSARKRPGSRDPYVVAQVVLAEASMLRRRGFAAALTPLGLCVHGDPHWREMVPDVDLAGMLDYEQALPALFASSAINANVTAAQMPTAVNQRVFDVPAVGGFLLTDAQEDALELFREDEEIVVYRSFDEAADKVRFYHARPAARASIAHAAQSAVNRFHRYTDRVAMIDEQMRRRFASNGVKRGAQP